ncbi:caspase [Hokovirus HKV1]|uniref:Caspase n=1 Tax=Hokovirus HKV1 TaxID=1977638 RepID=A0A1V0SH21_9VIRU|nr:caspase [Hokovirus HKV1]
MSIVKKALLIGINYTGSQNELNGCINDSMNLKKFLLSNKYFLESDMIMMNDNLKGNLYPNKANIEYQFNELVKFAQNNVDKKVELFISYSGHGTNVVDKNGDEKDGYDEALVPIDFLNSGFIIDDNIRINLVDKMHKNVSLTILCDSCHSGTMCDLKYLYTFDKQLYTADSKYKDTLCNIVTISGCKDSQTSADAYIKTGSTYTYQGAMTASFIANYKDEITYRNLIVTMKSWLAKKLYTQIPQLCSGKLVNVDSPFLLSSYN